MRPLSEENISRPVAGRVDVLRLLTTAVYVSGLGVWIAGCGGGAGFVEPPPPPPPAIMVSIAPLSGMVLLGNALSFTATVTNTGNTGVNWSVNGIAGGNAAVGTISTTGTYTAPADLPSPATVQVTATSQADATKSETAAVTIQSDIAVSIAPTAAGVELGASQAFHATITSGGHPDTALRWSVSGEGCAPNCGTVDSNGNYTAPPILPTNASVMLTAQSVADSSKRATATINITSNFTLQISAPASVPTGGAATLVATLTAVAGSNPSTALTWSLAGAGCSGSACGTLTVVITQSAGGNATASTAMYTAPAIAPSPNTVTVTVTPQADASKRAQATLTIQPIVTVSISPGTATLAANHRVTLTAQVNGSSNTGLNWSVNGIPGGSALFGQTCVVSSNPCQIVTSGNASQVDYLAPGAIPSPNPASVQATSAADATKSATAQITVINHVVVSVQPASVMLAPLATQGFMASVLGTSNQSVVWQIQGTACAVSGACGTVDPNGTYAAPTAAPSPDSLRVVAVSSDDTSQSGAANVTISTGADILSLHPASVYAGAADGFTLLVGGSGFVATNGANGSSLVINGTARTTTCSSTTDCTATVAAADVAAPSSVSVQIKNPDGSMSNAVELVVAAPNASDDLISLSSAVPAATSKDIVVVEPTTAGVTASGTAVDLNVAALGGFSPANNSCTLAGNPLAVQRPASGTSTTDICVFSQGGLDVSMTYTVSGAVGDVTVIAKQPAGLGIIHLTLQISATAQTGPRTLFIQTTNLDKTAASGALVIE
jgi:hypothetical protein